MSYNSKYKGSEVESLLDKVNGMGDIPTKVSQLENDVPYVTEDVVSNGVYAVDANNKLIDYNTADSSCIGVALVAGEHKFMIAKADATDGTNTTLYWDKDYSDLSLTNYSNTDGTNRYGYFGGTSTPQLNKDFTTWTAGALSDFNGKANTAIIAAASSDARDMCTVLNTFNAADSYNDWYVPACGQLALMYLNMTEINVALAKIGGTALTDGSYWSSSEYSSNLAWRVLFYYGYVFNNSKSDTGGRVRFIRDITPTKHLKERVYALETSKQDRIEDLDVIRDGASKGATALQEEQYKGTVTSITAGEGLAGGTITGSGIISLAEKTQNGKSIDLMSKVDILKIGNTPSDTNITIDKTSSVWMDKMLNFDKFGRLNGIDGYYYYPTKVTFGEATTSLKGLMSASDKIKLDFAVTCVKINGTTKNPSNGVVDLGTVITSHQDISGKQDKLVSGTNIKTINGESILGSGNIVISGGSSSDIYVLETSIYESGVVSAEEFEKIRQCKILVLSMYLGMMTIVLQSKVNHEDELLFSTTMCYSSAALYVITFNLNEDGSAGWSLTNTQQYFKTINGESILGESEGDITISGGGSSSGGSGAYVEVNHGTGDTTFTLTPNTFHIWEEVAALDLSFADETAGVANEYLFQFTSGATATTLTLPDGLKWANDSAPTIDENMIYQVSVLKGLASVLEFSNAAALIENKATLINSFTGEVRFDYPVASDLEVILRGDMTGTVNFVSGQQTAVANHESQLEPYFIHSISIQTDNTYIYTF